MWGLVSWFLSENHKKSIFWHYIVILKGFSNEHFCSSGPLKHFVYAQNWIGKTFFWHDTPSSASEGPSHCSTLGDYRFFAKFFCQSEITSVICMKNWFYVQNYGMIVYRESGFAKKWQNWIAPFLFNWIPGLIPKNYCIYCPHSFLLHSLLLRFSFLLRFFRALKK